MLPMVTGWPMDRDSWAAKAVRTASCVKTARTQKNRPAEATTTIPDQQAAFDRQLHARPRRLCPSEADDLQRTQKQRRTPLAHESERQPRDVQVEALAELATGDRTRGGHRIL